MNKEIALQKPLSKFVLLFLLIFSSSSVIASTLYGDNESDWQVRGKNPEVGTVSTVYESLLDKSVVKLEGDESASVYLLGGLNSAAGWNNQSEFLLSWRLRSTGITRVYVRLDTRLGIRNIAYNRALSSRLLENRVRTIHHGLGTSLNDGEWHTWSRDLVADLKAAEPDNEIITVNGLFVRGNLEIDSIELDASDQSPRLTLSQGGDKPLIPAFSLLGETNDPDVVAYQWRDSSGVIVGEQARWLSQFNEPGLHTLSLEVTNVAGRSAIESVTVNVIDTSIPMVYSDAENASVMQWRIADNNPLGASIQDLDDANNPENKITQLSGAGLKNSYILGHTNPSKGWNNTLQKIITWRSATNEAFRIYIRVTTALGWRYIWYDASNQSHLNSKSANYIHHGLGESAKDGQWHTFTRNLSADLKAAEPDNSIIAVHAMVVRGNLLIDDVAMLGSSEPSEVPVPIAAFTATPLSGPAPLTIQVDASASTDTAAINNYRWEFADQNLVEGEAMVMASHEFLQPGQYAISLTVTNAAGGTDKDTLNITVTDSVPAAELSPEQAARLLTQATFGPTTASIAQVQAMGIEPWIDAQLLLKGPSHLSYTMGKSGPVRDPRHEIFWLDAVDGEDQLRNRVAFALSQLFVISDIGYTLANAPHGVTNYYDILRNQAFGNYRDLLEDVTLNPVMGIFLSMLQNDKGNEENNTRADENFAREVLQLFSIGLTNLNQDGTDAGGEAFTQTDVENFARVFTGWNYKDAGRWARPLFTGQDLINPMEPYEDHHDTGSKVLLGGQVVPAGLSASEDLQVALDNIFAHQNVGPFISRHLIKHLVTSNPTPAYVGRVAGVFNNNGSGVRGDMGATVKAVLMDPEARNVSADPNYGKLREPVLRWSHLWRAFHIIPGRGSVRGEYNTYSPALKNLETQTGQAVLRAPSVFNFYSPSYVPTGPVRDAGLLAPEFEIFTDGNIISTATRINNQVHRHFTRTDQPTDLTPSQLDYTAELALAENPQALLDHLDLLLMSGAMSNELNDLLLEHISSLPNDEEGHIARVQNAISLMVASPEYLVQR